jgi:hypothetical protein
LRVGTQLGPSLLCVFGVVFTFLLLVCASLRAVFLIRYSNLVEGVVDHLGFLLLFVIILTLFEQLSLELLLVRFDFPEILSFHPTVDHSIEDLLSVVDLLLSSYPLDYDIRLLRQE